MNNNTSYFHSPPQHLVIPFEERRMNEALVEKKIAFINRLYDDVVVCERSNLRMYLPSNPHSGKSPAFIVRIDYRFATDKVKNNTEVLLDRLRNIGQHLMAFKSAFQCEANQRAYGGLEFTIEYSLTREELEELGGTVYFKELDLIVSINEAAECPNHPFSYESDGKQTVVVNNSAEACFNIDVVINDPQDRYGNRFINLLGNVHCIKATKIPQLREGLYVNKVLGGVKTTDYYTFSQADEQLRLFRTYDESLTYGNGDLLIRRETAELEQRNLITKKELEDQKTRLQQREVECETKRQQLDLEREEFRALRERQDWERKAEMERVKDQYEHRSYVRKDSSETLKILPAVVMGLSALIVGFKTLFS